MAASRRKRRLRPLKWIGIALLFALLFCVGYVAAVAAGAPKIDTLDAMPKGYRSSVLDDAGEVVLNLSGEASNRVYVRLDEVPEDLQHAFVAIEDERFYKHHGIDLPGIARAVVRGIKGGGFSEGASTITQQLLKNNVFTEWTAEVTFRDRLERKIQEQYLALKLERKADKSWIMENYINTINLGGGNWGAETASRYYFNKDVSELTLSECAVLAGITKNPTTYNPLLNPENNAARRETVLAKMLEQGYIDEEAYEEALADPVYDRIAEVHTAGPSGEIMTYFEDALINELITDLKNAGHTEAAAWDLLYKGGLVIYSTENSRMQAACERAAADPSYFTSDEQVSIVVIDNETGQVKAMIGGRGEKDASLILNRATTGVFQPGSTIKVIGTYAAGLEGGDFTLGTAYDDAPYAYSDGTDIANASGTYAGMMTVREAIARSNNVVALKCFQQTGMDDVFAQLQAFGISTLTDADRVEALALGGTSGGVTNLEMTAAYATIARGGTYRAPTYYTKVTDRHGNLLLGGEQETHQAVSTQTAGLLTDAMTDVLTDGTGSTADFEGTALAGKSGTTNGIRDAWFIGFSPSCTCGVWGGFDSHKEQESSRYVQQIWKAVMQEAAAARGTESFAANEGLTTVTICKKCGKRANEGICDHTLQGDETCEEYFVPGTEPTDFCDCHVAIEVCASSGQKAGAHCPSKQTRVYLTHASAGTDDVQYVMPAGLDSTSCGTHKHFWSGWFGRDDESGSGQNSGYGGEDSQNSGYGSEDAQDSGYESDDAQGDQQQSSGESWWQRVFPWW